MKQNFILALIIFALLAFTLLVSPAHAVETIRTGDSYWLEFHGNRLLSPVDVTTVLTDASPTVTYTVKTVYIGNLMVDLSMDKGATMVITPLPDVDNLATTGLPSDTLTIPDGGGTDRAIYTAIGAPYAKITVTKTEAGSTTSFLLSIRGIQQ